MSWFRDRVIESVKFSSVRSCLLVRSPNELRLKPEGHSHYTIASIDLRERRESMTANLRSRIFRCGAPDYMHARATLQTEHIL